VIPNRVQRGQRLDQKTVEQLKEKYTDRVSPVVRKSQDVSNLQAEGKTLFAVSEDELLSTAIEARDAFAAATDQLLTTLTND
jgi:chromosome partitioning protein